MKVKEFINGDVIYDKEGQYFFIMSNEGLQMLAELRGWGAIQNLKAFKNNGKIDVIAASQFHDDIGQWIAEAINEKLKRDKK